MPKEARELLCWYRKKDALEKLPLDHIDLCGLSMGDLRTIASLFKAYDGAAMRPCSRSELVSFICGYQQSPEQYLPLGPMPYGSLIYIEGA